ncbi:hypothetical protein AB0O70_16925, partial [Microbacterium paraoxydans]
AVDPTAYPDVNPIFDADDPDARPSAADVRAAAAAAAARPAPTADSDEPGEASSTQGALVPLLIGGGVLVAVLLVGGIILAVVLARSSRRRNNEHRGAQDR